MSEQMVVEFLEATRKDAALLDRAKASSSLAGVVKVAEEAGFTFTESEVTSLGEILQEAQTGGPQGELADSDLERVSGGVTINNSHYPADVMVNINNSHREVFGGLLQVDGINRLY